MKTYLSALILPLLIGSCNVLKPIENDPVNHLLEAIIPDHAVTGSSPAVAIARPALPGYLDRSQLVIRAGDGTLKMNPYQIWAEPIDAAISRVTALNLGRLTHSLNIQPVENFITLDYEWLLEIRIARFEPDASGRLNLECTWKLQPTADKRIASTHSFSTSVAMPSLASGTSSQDQSGQTAAMNEALARLAREIARSL